MCGIAGFIGVDAPEKASAMTRALAHRGPDDEGVWTSPTFPLSLGNRRLQIVDLSPAGHQPMLSADRRLALTFNGEIYNDADLRAELEQHGHSFRSQTDTEVVLHAFAEWGSAALSRIRGMFAFALWDEAERTLLIARDRLGVKPLYYAVSGGAFAFASEIRSLLTSKLIAPELDPASLESYLRLLWVPEPRTLFRRVRKLEPGTYLQWRDEQAKVVRYWDVPKPCGGTPSAEEFRETLSAAVARQLRSDVPVGAFLSGGVDSTAIVAMCQRAASRQLRTYSIGFRTKDRAAEGAYDDLAYARIAAKKFGTEHLEIILEPDVASILPRVVRHLEDPIADPAAINCLLISEAARSSSTVLLAGTGGDELFGGYRKYATAMLLSGYRILPGPLRELVLEPLVRRLPVRIGGRGIRAFRFAKKLVRYAGDPLLDRFIGYSSYYDSPELSELLGKDLGAVDPYRGVWPLVEAWNSRGTDDVIDRMTYVDLKYYLPGLNLAYMDKASMAASVEVRVPLLDEALIDLASRIPGNRKVRGTRTKVAFREALRDVVPAEILSRPKAPFAVPIRSWLAGDLAEYVQDVLNPSRVRARGLLDPNVVQALVREHHTGREDHSLRIWALLTLELWMQEFCDNPAYAGSSIPSREIALAPSVVAT
ncbi:MAG TPA: asparagine synthase (glutamine-hydrolyzing) [Candidatus Binatia bacterium]|nr:asparagine synthase (glutamine-hydrolyzing) [Candidatus Binatia bacterium]